MEATPKCLNRPGNAFGSGMPSQVQGRSTGSRRIVFMKRSLLVILFGVGNAKFAADVCHGQIQLFPDPLPPARADTRAEE